ncbi:MAG: MoxR family ATPase [Clostridia bacterium]|nr:MoxR family ATPase [Deltaproteobacteria bacterium]
MAATPLRPVSSDLDINAQRARVKTGIDAVATVLKGNRTAIELAFAALFARGHVLLEDVPGVGKTTLARAIARVLGCSFSRIQFTSDLLPSDVLGVQILDQQRGSFAFKRGPVFANVVLADEINRASPKTQSAMLEAMADRQVTIDDETHLLAAPFIVLATQNPTEHHGAYPLPESQLDRFMVCTGLGYPPHTDERALLMAPRAAGNAFDALNPHFDVTHVNEVCETVDNVTLSTAIADYILALVQATRAHPDIILGCSPRGALAYAAVVRAWAFIRGRDYVIPDDVKALAKAVLSHRIMVTGTRGGDATRHHALSLIDQLVSQVPVPR